ncbi:MAG: hypothetical protein LBT38_06980 [Deltaproteobacteria bacterium]|jgi:hypothetical protein|nr:hypothetical protein [Deltaproteobacteria bacterium]
MTRSHSSKALTFLASLLIFSLFSQAPLLAEVMDLNKWAKAGLPESIRQKMVIQSLSHRARPPLSGDFLLEMVRYGGENLALSYINMDSATAQEPQAPLTPEVVKRLMGSGVPRADLEMVINAAQKSGSDQSATLVAPIVAPVPEELRPVVEEEVKPYKPAPVVAPARPEPPKAEPLPTPSQLRKIPQTLVPGQPADPSRPLPPNPSPYHIREPKGSNGVFLGVQEVKKPDGHVYQVNSNGRQGLQGYEVLSRPSGHKVYRHHSGRTDQTYNNDNWDNQEEFGLD